MTFVAVSTCAAVVAVRSATSAHVRRTEALAAQELVLGGVAPLGRRGAVELVAIGLDDEPAVGP